MAQPVTVYRWDDPGAPQLPNGKPSEIINVLKKCLEEGYGEKSPLGWTSHFHDTTNQAIAFRNNVANGGSGGYVKIYSSDNSDNNNTLMFTRPSVSMTSISNLFRPGYIRPFAALAGTGDTKMDKWALIGTPTAFYFFISRNNRPMYDVNAYGATLFIGDFFSVVPNDAGRFIVLTSPTSTGDDTNLSFTESLDGFSLYSPLTAASSQDCLKLYDADGFEAFGSYAAIPPLGQGSGNNVLYAGAPTLPAILYPITVELANTYTSNYQNVTDREGVISQRSLTRPQTRGIIPGFFINKFGGYRDDPWPKIVNINDQNYWLLRNTGGPARVMVNMEVWDDPFSQV